MIEEIKYLLDNSMVFFCKKFIGHCYCGYLALGARSLKFEFGC